MGTGYSISREGFAGSYGEDKEINGTVVWLLREDSRNGGWMKLECVSRG